VDTDLESSTKDIIVNQALNERVVKGKPPVQPRGIRSKDAPGYLGINRNKFDKEVRPYLVAISMGKHTIIFDRYDLDAWFDKYKSENGRVGLKAEDNLWRARKLQDLSNEEASGILTSLSEGQEYAKALERVTSKKRKGS
jgi:hypothetical protein